MTSGRSREVRGATRASVRPAGSGDAAAGSGVALLAGSAVRAWRAGAASAAPGPLTPHPDSPITASAASATHAEVVVVRGNRAISQGGSSWVVAAPGPTRVAPQR